MTQTTFRLILVEAGLARLAGQLATIVHAGDMIALRGELGAGKTTFARYLLQQLLGNAAAEIPSPTFSLLQTYATPRMEVVHADFYRLEDPDEANELGLEDMAATALTLIEWPEQAEHVLLADRFELLLKDGADPASRLIELSGYGQAAMRLSRLMDVRDFMAAAGWGDAMVTYLQGDASSRTYTRLHRANDSAVLMDAPPQPDGPPVHKGKPYSSVAHLAEDVRPFVAVADALRTRGFATPEIFACDLPRGLLLMQDFGGNILGDMVRSGHDMAPLWRAAVDVLLALRATPVPTSLPVRDQSAHALPTYDLGALEIELSLLPDWYWPLVNGSPMPGPLHDAYTEAWRPVLDRLLALPPAWVLRDYHSPNLMWFDGGSRSPRIGLLDFQDAVRGPAAYDLVSLLQDARIDVPATLEAELLEHYCKRAIAGPTFDRAEFTFAYAALGAQRNTKILGIFARLAKRDGKPGYLQHLPRIWSYLERDLAHPELADLRGWYDQHLPVNDRRKPLGPTT